MKNLFIGLLMLAGTASFASTGKNLVKNSKVKTEKEGNSSVMTCTGTTREGATVTVTCNCDCTPILRRMLAQQ